MRKRIISFVMAILIVSLLLISGCSKQAENSSACNTSSTCAVEKPESQIANPASVFCIEKGFKSEIRTADDGSQFGVCIANGKECDEWEFYRGECEL